MGEKIHRRARLFSRSQKREVFSRIDGSETRFSECGHRGAGVYFCDDSKSIDDGLDQRRSIGRVERKRHSEIVCGSVDGIFVHVVRFRFLTRGSAPGKFV